VGDLLARLTLMDPWAYPEPEMTVYFRRTNLDSSGIDEAEVAVFGARALLRLASGAANTLIPQTELARQAPAVAAARLKVAGSRATKA